MNQRGLQYQSMVQYPFPDGPSQIHSPKKYMHSMAMLFPNLQDQIHIFHVSSTSLMLSRHQRPDVPGISEASCDPAKHSRIATEVGMPVIVTPLRLFQSCFIAPVFLDDDDDDDDDEMMI